MRVRRATKAPTYTSTTCPHAMSICFSSRGQPSRRSMPPGGKRAVAVEPSKRTISTRSAPSTSSGTISSPRSPSARVPPALTSLTPRTVLLRASRQDSTTWITSAPSPASVESPSAVAHTLSMLLIAHSPRGRALGAAVRRFVTAPARGFWPPRSARHAPRRSPWIDSAGARKVPGMVVAESRSATPGGVTQLRDMARRPHDIVVIRGVTGPIRRRIP